MSTSSSLQEALWGPLCTQHLGNAWHIAGAPLIIWWMTDGFQVRQLGILNTRSLRKEIKAYLKDQRRNWYLLFFLTILSIPGTSSGCLEWMWLMTDTELLPFLDHDSARLWTHVAEEANCPQTSIPPSSFYIPPCGFNRVYGHPIGVSLLSNWVWPHD